MSLASIPPWLLPLWERWRDAHAAGRLPHAILVAGPPGAGKRELAETFVRGALCREPAAGLPCGVCPSCKQFASHRQLRRKSHPDIDWVTASRYSIGVDDVREQVIARLARTSSYDRFKFLVIEPAERMTRAAANALLKSLEEPPPDNALFLLSHQPGRLPPTIRSRCQKYVLPEPPPAEGRAWLLEQLEPEAADAALAAADGRPLRALQMHRDGQVPLRAAFEQDLAAMLANRQSESEFAAAWHVRPAAETAKSGEEEEPPPADMDLRFAWLLARAAGQARARAAAGAPARELLAALDCYRELLELRAAEAEAPAPQLHLEAACFALSGAAA